MKLFAMLLIVAVAGCGTREVDSKSASEHLSKSQFPIGEMSVADNITMQIDWDDDRDDKRRDMFGLTFEHPEDDLSRPMLNLTIDGAERTFAMVDDERYYVESPDSPTQRGARYLLAKEELKSLVVAKVVVGNIGKLHKFTLTDEHKARIKSFISTR